MKKLMIAIMLCLSMTGMAQSEWERPDIQTQKSDKSVKTEKESSTEDAKYLAGAVPEVNGEVVWTLDLQVPGKNAQQIYDIVLNYLVDLVKQENQLEGSTVSLVNKQEHKQRPDPDVRISGAQNTTGSGSPAAFRPARSFCRKYLNRSCASFVCG